MAIYHMHISNISRAKGSTSCATLSYISGKAVYDERLGKKFNYGRKERVIYNAVILPMNAPAKYKNASALFNSIEKFETAGNARTGKKIEVALPRELNLMEHSAILEEFIKSNIAMQGYASTFAIHTDSDGNNPHAHIIIANRQIGADGEWKNKRKMEYVLDERGERIPKLDKKTGLQKIDKNGRKQWERKSTEINLLDKQSFLEELREKWAIECNFYLQESEKIDHRSFETLEKYELPTIHEGYAARKMEKRGEISMRCEENRAVLKFNNEVMSVIEEALRIKKENEEKTKDIEILGDKIDSLVNEQSTLLPTIRKLKAEIQEKQNKALEFDLSVKKYQDDINILKDKKESVQSELDALQDDIINKTDLREYLKNEISKKELTLKDVSINRENVEILNKAYNSYKHNAQSQIADEENEIAFNGKVYKISTGVFNGKKNVSLPLEEIKDNNEQIYQIKSLAYVYEKVNKTMPYKQIDELERKREELERENRSQERRYENLRKEKDIEQEKYEKELEKTKSEKENLHKQLQRLSEVAIDKTDINTGYAIRRVLENEFSESSVVSHLLDDAIMEKDEDEIFYITKTSDITNFDLKNGIVLKDIGDDFVVTSKTVNENSVRLNEKDFDYAITDCWDRKITKFAELEKNINDLQEKSVDKRFGFEMSF